MQLAIPFSALSLTLSLWPSRLLGAENLGAHLALSLARAHAHLATSWSGRRTELRALARVSARADFDWLAAAGRQVAFIVGHALPARRHACCACAPTRAADSAVSAAAAAAASASAAVGAASSRRAARVRRTPTRCAAQHAHTCSATPAAAASNPLLASLGAPPLQAADRRPTDDQSSERAAPKSCPSSATLSLRRPTRQLEMQIGEQSPLLRNCLSLSLSRSPTPPSARPG